MPFTKGPDLSRLQHVIGGEAIGGDKPGEGKGRLVLGILPKGTPFLVLRTEPNRQKTLHRARTRNDYLFSIRDGKLEDLGLVRSRRRRRRA